MRLSGNEVGMRWGSGWYQLWQGCWEASKQQRELNLKTVQCTIPAFPGSLLPWPLVHQKGSDRLARLEVRKFISGSQPNLTGKVT